MRPTIKIQISGGVLTGVQVGNLGCDPKEIDLQVIDWDDRALENDEKQLSLIESDLSKQTTRLTSIW